MNKKEILSKMNDFLKEKEDEPMNKIIFLISFLSNEVKIIKEEIQKIKENKNA